MNYAPLYAWLCFYLCLLCTYGNVYAQESVEQADLKNKFAQVEVFMNSFKNDSALIILKDLILELTDREQLNTPFGLRVQNREAEALEKDNQNEEAIEKLLHVLDVSKKNKQWDVLAHAYLSLARLHEKLGRKENCIQRLREAEATITTNKLDSIYPRYSLRISSYYRVFDIDVDSAIYYANQVLITAPKFKLKEEEAVGHLLMGMLLDDDSYKEIIRHYNAAGWHWLKTEDYTGYCAILGNLSSIYMDINEPERALIYNDSSLIAAKKATAMGNDGAWMYYANYKERGTILKILGQYDSAWHYMEKGYRMELDDVYQTNNEKVVEIEAKYNDSKKSKKILEQSKLIEYEQDRRNVLLRVFIIFFFLALLLAYYYFSLRKANRKMQKQRLTIEQYNRELSSSLDQQMVLQGEIHHRVKNNLQVIISLLELQMDETDNQKIHKSFKAMSGRIYSMAAIHEILYQQEGLTRVDFYDYINTLCKHHSKFSKSDEETVFNLDIKEQSYNLGTSMPLGIIITELLTNSLKYARVRNQALVISIKLEKMEEGFCLTYKDNGPGFSNGKIEEREGGLGSYLLKSMSRQLRGYLESKNDEGALYKVYFFEKNG